MVALRASDPMTGLGAANILGKDPRLAVVAEDELAMAQVIVVVEESLTDQAFGPLRDVRATAWRAAPPRCVIVTDHFRVDVLMSVLECGIAAVLPRSTTNGDDLVRTVLAVNDGEAHLPPVLQGRLLTHLDRLQREVLEPHGLTLSGLSARERDILRLLADGHSTDQIADALAYSESTVKNVLHNLMRRHGLKTRAHAVAYALRAGAI